MPEHIQCQRQMAITPTTANPETMTVSAVLTTDARAFVRDSRGRIIEEILLMDGMMLPQRGSVPFLLDHSRKMRDQIGAVSSIQRESDKAVGSIEFDSDDQTAQRMWSKVQKGMATDVSIGYTIYDSVLINAGETKPVRGTSYSADQVPLRISTQWMIDELSLVTIGADPSATFRSMATQEENTMDPETPNVPAADEATRAANPAPPGTPPAVNVEAERAAAIAAERARVSEITGLALPKDVHARAVAEGWDPGKAAVEGLRALNASRPDPAPSISVGSTGTESARDAIMVAWCQRHGIHTEASPDAVRNARDFSGTSLQNAARCLLESSGARVSHLGANELGKRAFSNTEFTYLLAGVANAALKSAYAAAPGTFTQWAGRRVVSNFLTRTEIDANIVGSVQKVGNSGKIEYLAASDSKETYRAYTYAALFGVTREAWMNDDLSGITRIPAQLAQAFARNIDDAAYAALYSNTGVGPTMLEDSAAMFATHAQGTNYGTSTATSTLNKTGLANARAFLRKIKRGSNFLNLTPSFLIVPPELEAEANEWAGSQNLAIAVGGTAGSQVTVTQPTNNVVAGWGLRVIVEPRLALADAGTTAWYLAASPAQAESLVYVSVNGNDAPMIETFDQDPSMLGYMVRGVHDFGIGAVDWRQIVRMKGA